LGFEDVHLAQGNKCLSLLSIYGISVIVHTAVCLELAIKIFMDHLGEVIGCEQLACVAKYVCKLLHVKLPWSMKTDAIICHSSCIRVKPAIMKYVPWSFKMILMREEGESKLYSTDQWHVAAVLLSGR
jgi:hypothetical protein